MRNPIVRLPAVVAATGKSRPQIYADITDGSFPNPVKIGARAVGWPAYEVEAMNGARIAGQSAEEIKNLVKLLVANRKSAALDFDDLRVEIRQHQRGLAPRMAPDPGGHPAVSQPPAHTEKIAMGERVPPRQLVRGGNG